MSDRNIPLLAALRVSLAPVYDMLPMRRRRERWQRSTGTAQPCCAAPAPNGARWRRRCTSA
jgi:hypothetical protein